MHSILDPTSVDVSRGDDCAGERGHAGGAQRRKLSGAGGGGADGCGVDGASINVSLSIGARKSNQRSPRHPPWFEINLLFHTSVQCGVS
jgi:hypothetical protein